MIVPLRRPPPPPPPPPPSFPKMGFLVVLSLIVKNSSLWLFGSAEPRRHSMQSYVTLALNLSQLPPSYEQRFLVVSNLQSSVLVYIEKSFQRLLSMSDSARGQRFASPGTAISVLALFLYCAGFIRTEFKLQEQNQRIEKLETKCATKGFPQSLPNTAQGERELSELSNLVNSFILQDQRLETGSFIPFQELVNY